MLVTGASGHIGGSVAAALGSCTMGSNSRVPAVCGDRELGWAPHRRSLLEDVEHGSCREAA
jgi:hypothetical protein